MAVFCQMLVFEAVKFGQVESMEGVAAVISKVMVGFQKSMILQALGVQKMMVWLVGSP
jgi:hypothetical protein